MYLVLMINFYPYYGRDFVFCSSREEVFACVSLNRDRILHIYNLSGKLDIKYLFFGD